MLNKQIDVLGMSSSIVLNKNCWGKVVLKQFVVSDKQGDIPFGLRLFRFLSKLVPPDLSPALWSAGPQPCLHVRNSQGGENGGTWNSRHSGLISK